MATEDILINDGDSFISLTELTAAQVDCNLPIESTDGTVVVDGASSVFTVSTGGTERVKVEDTKTTFNGQIRNLTASTTVAYLESTAGAATIKLNSTGQDWWVGPNSFGFCIFDDSLKQDKFVFDAAGNFIVNEGQVQTPSITGLAANDAAVTLGQQATLKAGDGSEYVPTNPASIATKKIVDDKIWVGTTAAYNALATKNPTTLYCLTD